MRRGRVDEKKAEQERLQNLLLDMLKEDDNKYCADCQAKTPRWAAWNLGVFICIRCAGIHRNLGVHISKVRSVNLDSWTAEQVQSMRVMGNEKARKVYEHSLPDHFRRSMADHQLEQFIRAKYEQKRYMLSGFVYPQVDVNDLPKQGHPNKHRTSTRTALTTPTSIRMSVAPSEKPTTVVNDLLDLSTPVTSTNQANGNTSLVDDFNSLSLDVQQDTSTNQTPELDDVFGSYASAPIIDTALLGRTSEQSSPVDNATSQPATTSQGYGDLVALSGGGSEGNERKSNADILSLFGDKSKGPTQPIMPVGGFAAFGLQAVPSQSAQTVSGKSAYGMLPVKSENSSIGEAPSLKNTGFANAVPPLSHGLHPQGFPNPFDQPSASMMMQSLQGLQFSPGSVVSGQVTQPVTPTSPTSCSARANNAFADLSIGKVLNMNYMGGKPKNLTRTPQMTASPANMNFDDLLGL